MSIFSLSSPVTQTHHVVIGNIALQNGSFRLHEGVPIPAPFFIGQEQCQGCIQIPVGRGHGAAVRRIPAVARLVPRHQPRTGRGLVIAIE